MLKMQRILVIGLLAFAIPAFAQHGHSGGMGGPPAGAGSGMGADHGMSGDHSMGPSSNAPGSQHGSMASQSPDKVLSHNTAIASKIKALTGQDASTACSGFKNLGQCVAAAHVSKNLGITFADLKAKMTGTGSVSLGKAIQNLQPSANAKAETKKANKQAQQDIKDSTAS